MPGIVLPMPLPGGALLHRVFTCLFAWLLVATACGCYRVPAEKHAVESVTISGISTIEDDEIYDAIATRESTRFLGLFEGVVYEYEVFDQYALRRDLQRIERYLRAHGYYEAHVHTARVEERGNKVYVTITVQQGEPVLVDAMSFAAVTPLDTATRDALQKEVKSVLKIGDPFEEDKFADAEKTALKGLTSRGHAAA